jgi:hypothetical protein
MRVKRFELAERVVIWNEFECTKLGIALEPASSAGSQARCQSD